MATGIPGALCSAWKSEDRLCLVAGNAHEYVALQNKWTIMCIYLSNSTDHCSWKATFCVYGYIYLEFILCPVLLQFYYLLKMHFTVMWKGVHSENVDYSFWKLAWWGRLFYQIEYFLAYRLNQCFYSLFVILSRIGFWIIFPFQVWFPLLFGFEFKLWKTVNARFVTNSSLYYLIWR